MLKLDKEDEIIVFRSAGIGDFLVIVPFINYLLNIVGISEEKINFVIINNQDFNPLKLIFDKNSPLVYNSIVLNPNKIFKETIKVKKKYFNKKFSKTIYLPFVTEKNGSRYGKLLLIKLISGLWNKVYGLSLKKQTSKITTQYLSYFDLLGLKNFNEYLNFDIQKILKISSSEIEKVNNLILKTKNKKIALYINSKLRMKIWSRGEYFKVVNYLNENYDVDIYLIGGVEDYKYNNDFIEEFKLFDLKNIAGKISIRESFIFFNSIDLIIGNDGAPLHMAAFSNCAILGIYTFKEEIGSWEPYKSNRFITVRKDVSCKHCYLEFCQNTICLQTLKFIDISSFIDNLLVSKTIRQSVIIY